MNDMNVWSKKQFLSMHDRMYMYAGDKLLKQPAYGFSDIIPWHTHGLQPQPSAKVKRILRSDPDLKRRLQERSIKTTTV